VWCTWGRARSRCGPFPRRNWWTAGPSRGARRHSEGRHDQHLWLRPAHGAWSYDRPDQARAGSRNHGRSVACVERSEPLSTETKKRRPNRHALRKYLRYELDGSCRKMVPHEQHPPRLPCMVCRRQVRLVTRLHDESGSWRTMMSDICLTSSDGSSLE